jgi:CBS domain-containing protein
MFLIDSFNLKVYDRNGGNWLGPSTRWIFRQLSLASSHFFTGGSTFSQEVAMATVSFLLAEKGSEIHSISPSATVLDAVHCMNDSQIGALVVMRDDRMVGMFTERDVLRRVLAYAHPPHEVTVGQVMTAEVISCEPDTDIEEVRRIMKEHRIRHLPVCDSEGKMHGLVSIGDLNAYHVGTQERTINNLTDYIYGRA